jgi:hypothetical protein
MYEAEADVKSGRGVVKRVPLEYILHSTRYLYCGLGDIGKCILQYMCRCVLQMLQQLLLQVYQYIVWL